MQSLHTAFAIRILIVEDFHAETEVLLRELNDAELLYEVQVVNSEKAFKNALVSFHPTVILSPYSLAKTNAVKLLGIARVAEVDAPFILLAYDLSEDIAIDLLGEGMEDYIQRSTIKRLPVAIKKALQRYKTQLELQLSEIRLKASEVAMRNMVRKMPIAVAMFDVDMNYLVVSDTWLKHENKTEEELIGNWHYDVVPEIPDAWKKVHQKVLSGETHGSDREKMDRSDGTVEVLRWKMNPWYDANGSIGGAVLFIEDITKTIEARSKEEKNQQLLAIGEDLGNSGSFELDMNSGTARWSDNMYKIKGFELKADISHESYIKHVHPEDRPKYLETFSRIQSSVAPQRFEYRLIRPDNGKVVCLRVASTFLTNSQGEIDRLIGTVQDVTEAMAFEQELLEKEQVFREMAENIDGVFWLTDKTGAELLYMSPLYETMYGRSIEEVYENGDAWSENIHPDDKNRVFRAFREEGHLGKYDVEYRLVHADGVVKWVRARAFPIKDENGEVVRLAGITEEITEQKRDKEKIETLSLVASETVNGVLIQDATGKIEWANKAFTDIFGFETEEILGRRAWSFLRGESTNLRLAELAYEKVKSGKSFSSENVLYTKGKEPVWMTIAISPIFDDSGRLSKMVTVGTDITKQKELEELQGTMLKKLESSVKDRTSELEIINEELRAEMWENQRISDKLYHSNLDLKDSIQYAKRIQESILPKLDSIQESFSDLFILFLPRDIVSGDFYWHHKRAGMSFFAAIDCTGHGVPGALMSMIANELMNQVIIQKKLTDTGEILTLLNKLMIRTLRQKEEGTMGDGMDMSLCVIDHDSETLAFSGAFGSMYLVQDGILTVFNGNRHSIGGHLEDVQKTFETTLVNIKKGDTIYLTSDGFVDQFGGEKGKKMMKKRFEQNLNELQKLPISKQKDALNKTLEDWKGELNQVDDILVAGLRY